MITAFLIAGLLVGCQTTTEPKEEVTSVTVDEVLSVVKEAYGDDYLPNVEIPAEFLEQEFGLTEDMYEEVIAEQPMIGAHADRLVIVKAAQEKADAVEVALTNARDKKVNDTMQYPMNLAKIAASKVVRHGDIITFVLLGAINEAEELSEADAKAFAEAEIEKGVNAINNLFK